ncbi:putative RNA-directed DNA polymerase, eukaryota, reverse transcriptase zinc-binding domain protein [Tanacetum coccineum]
MIHRFVVTHTLILLPSSAVAYLVVILCIWNSLVFIKHKILCNDYYVVVDGLWIPGDVQIRWIVVYAPQNLVSKIALWSSLSNLTANWDGILVVMGDFHEVRNASEKKGTPDHRPILLKEFVVDYGPTTFRFFHSWLEMDGFHDLVINKWSNDGIVDSNEHQARLSFIDAKVDQGCASKEDFIHRKDSLKILGELDHLEIKDLAQKAKLKWALESDENSGFFHNTLKKKRRHLAIKGILKNREWIEDPNLAKAEFLDHFRTRFKLVSGISPSLDVDMFNPLSSSQRESLDQNITREEIKRAVWDCGGDRAPGPDGFTFKFFKTFWDLIEGDVVRFVLDFFRTNSFPKGCNSSFIALIPKVHNAKLVSDFRPISLIGCQYKIIGKILANRLCGVIGSCINPVQSAFIKDRNILDGPLILNEILAWYQERNKKLMVFKVDFEKAFDSLRWDFLDLVMEKLGFGLKWRSWIQGCLRNNRSSILVNGSPTAEFEVFKGLRQGDPLSPSFLFWLWKVSMLSHARRRLLV